MLLHTPLYLVYLVGFVLLYWRLPSPASRRWALLLASYLFYAAFNVQFALLLAALTLMVYAIGRAIPGSSHARGLAFLGVTVNLAVLALFKYNGFFLDSLSQWGIASPGAGLRLLLPVGISFYTFQGIGYILEIYRQKSSPAKLIDLALYLAFFPKLIAGPIMAPAPFLAWIQQPPNRLPEADRSAALGLLLRGLVKKIIVADGLAGLADVAFRAADLPNGAAFPALLFWQGFYLYAIEIYADFSGYTDLARGSALLLGLRLPENFRQPYLSATLGEFWNRWHMSLTQWFREHLFFPLSRALLVRTRRRWPQAAQLAANLITMLIIGWWHGAALSFIAWGAWHGIWLSVERLSGWKPQGRAAVILTTLGTFHLVGMGWVLFRASSFAAAGRFFAGMFNFNDLQWLPGLLPPLVLAGGLTLALDLLETGRPRIPAGLRPLLVIAAVVLLTTLTVLGVVRGEDARPFIYGQF